MFGNGHISPWVFCLIGTCLDVSKAGSVFPNSTTMSSLSSTQRYHTAPGPFTRWAEAATMTMPPGAVEACDRGPAMGNPIGTVPCIFCNGDSVRCDRPGQPTYLAGGSNNKLWSQKPYGNTETPNPVCHSSFENTFMSWLWTAPMTPGKWVTEMSYCQIEPQFAPPSDQSNVCYTLAGHTPYYISEKFPFTPTPPCCGECTVDVGEVQVCMSTSGP